MRSVFLFIFSVISLISYGEEIFPNGKFLKDSIKIGEPIKYSLSVYHSSSTPILFPDTLYNFSPFELIRKEYFPTRTKGKTSFDSAIYIMRTFDLKSSQVISLPVYSINEGDSSSYYSHLDTVHLIEYLPEVPISLDLQVQADFVPVKKRINYPYFIAYSSIVFVVGLILYFLFGKTVKRRYNLFKVRSDHVSFEKNYNKLQKEFDKEKGPFTIEQALSIWKAYLARLENKPINTYTSTEIIHLYDKEELKNGLTIIDRAIYGGVISDEAAKALVILKRFSNRQYHIRKREIQNV
jgi:hypothetical protein